MKNFKLMIAASMLLVASAANAQFSNGGAQADMGNFQRVYVSYTNLDVQHVKGFSGVALGYAYDYRLTESTPLYLDFGARLGYNFGEKNKADYTLMSATIPVNLAYRFAAGESFSIMPYTGLSARYNILAKVKPEGADKVSLFDDPYKGKRFQCGWQIGANVAYKSITLGFEYGIDFIKFSEDNKTSTILVSLGYAF